MKGILAAVLIASTAFAEGDAPLVVLGDPLPRPALVVTKGEVVPFNGVLLDDAQAVQQGKRVVNCEATLKKAEESTLISTPVIVALIAGALTVGLGVGFGVAKIVK